MRAWFVTIAVAWSGSAHAEIPMYPTEITDRPLVLLPGMTDLDVALQLRTHVYTVIDDMGNSMLRRTAFGDDQTPYLAVRHAFGGVELEADLGKTADVNFRIDLGLPFTFGGGAAFEPKQPDRSYSEVQELDIEYKRIVAPHAFAVFAGAEVGLNERRDVFATGEQATGVSLFANAVVVAQTQLTRRLGITAGASIVEPLVDSSLESQSSLGVSTEILYALRRWDLLVAGSLGNVTRGHPSTFLSLGFSHRWGI